MTLELEENFFCVKLDLAPFTSSLSIFISEAKNLGDFFGDEKVWAPLSTLTPVLIYFDYNLGPLHLYSICQSQTEPTESNEVPF